MLNAAESLLALRPWSLHLRRMGVAAIRDGSARMASIFSFGFQSRAGPGLRMLSATNPRRRVVGRAYDGVRGVRDGPRAATPARDQLGPNSPRLGGYHAWRWRLDAARARRSGPAMGTGRRCR